MAAPEGQCQTENLRAVSLHPSIPAEPVRKNPSIAADNTVYVRHYAVYMLVYDVG